MSGNPITAHGIVLPVAVGEGYDQRRGAVALDVVCSDCDGTGVVANPEAEAWWEGFEAWHAGRIADATGPGPWRSLDLAAWETQHGDAPSPDELACGECEGRGWVLTPAGSAILALVRRHLSAS